MKVNAESVAINRWMDVQFFKMLHFKIHLSRPIETFLVEIEHDGLMYVILVEYTILSYENYNKRLSPKMIKTSNYVLKWEQLLN